MRSGRPRHAQKQLHGLETQKPCTAGCGWSKATWQGLQLLGSRVSPSSYMVLGCLTLHPSQADTGNQYKLAVTPTSFGNSACSTTAHHGSTFNFREFGTPLHSLLTKYVMCEIPNVHQHHSHPNTRQSYATLSTNFLFYPSSLSFRTNRPGNLRYLRCHPQKCSTQTIFKFDMSTVVSL